MAIAAVVTSASLSAKRKDDKVVVLNGDQFVCEIKQMANGELRLSAAYILDNFQLDWNRVRELTSLDMFRVFVSDGRQLTGLIALRAGGRFEVTPEGEPMITLVQSEVIGLLPVEASIWAQLTGKISSGFNYTSADNQAQLSVSGSLGYEADRYSFDLSGSANFSSHADATETTSTIRSNADLINLFPVGRQWFAANFLGLSNSEEQDLNLRSTAGGGIGWWFVRSLRVRFAATGGLIYTHECTRPRTIGETATRLRQSRGGRKRDVLVSSLQDARSPGEVRRVPELDVDRAGPTSFAPLLSVELVRNLNWDFSLYENYDSQPPVEAKKNDFSRHAPCREILTAGRTPRVRRPPRPSLQKRSTRPRAPARTQVLALDADLLEIDFLQRRV